MKITKGFAWLVLMVPLISACGGPATTRLAGSSDVPAASGVVRSETTKNGNTRLEISVQHLAPPERVLPGATLYVVWVRSLEPAAEAQNLGALVVDRDLNGEIAAVTPLRAFDLFITPESSGLITSPTGKTLLSARIERK